jgi:hypothetical protein
MADIPGANINPTPEDDSSGLSITRILMIGAGVVVIAILAVFGIALWIALTSGEVSNERIQYMRDVLISVLALQGIIVTVSIAVFIGQLARFINLLTSEFKPIMENMQNTVKEAQASVEFVSSNTIGPIIRISAFFAGLAAFFRELANIRGLIRHKDRKVTDESK